MRGDRERLLRCKPFTFGRSKIPLIGHEMCGEDKVWGHHLINEGTWDRKFPCLCDVRYFGTEPGGV